MAYLENFDANEVLPSSSFEPIPAGKYVALIIESQMKPTKSGAGEYLELTFEVSQGEYQRRLLWTRLNLKNSSDIAVEIARRDLSAICRAVGVLQPQDSEELHNREMVISVKCKKRPDTDSIANEIDSFAPYKIGSAPAAEAPQSLGSPPVATTASQAVGDANNNDAPWG